MWRSLRLLLLVVLVGCSSQSPAQVNQGNLPTLAALPTQAPNLDEAQRTATAFLSAWQAQDFVSMYNLLSFNIRETITFDDFRSRYQEAQTEMTFESLHFQERALSAVGNHAAQFSYSLTFQTRILGDIEDDGRTLTVILNTQTGLWSVAWTVGDIFAEFAVGARLEFQTNAPSRSNIYDRDDVVLADMRGRMVEVYVVQADVPDWDQCRQTLVDVIGVTAERIDAIYAAAQATWSMPVGRIERATYEAQESHLITDCNATFEGLRVRRYRPNGSLMPHIIGHVGLPTVDQVEAVELAGFNAETIIGQAGIEASWNDVLAGTPGGRLQIINPDGSVARTLAEVRSQVSESLWLTIDSDLQQFIINLFNTAYNENRFYADGSPGWGSISPGAAAIVMNIHTGEILAMVSYPMYDANAYNPYPAIGRAAANQIQADVAADVRNPLLNRATQGLYPAGSIFKVVDSAAVLETGVYQENTAFYCPGFWEFNGDYRRDWYGPGHGTVTVQSALKQSCNPFFYQTGFVLNNADPFFLPNYARRMGLGDYTGLRDLTEAPGQIPDPDLVLARYGTQWTYSNAINLSIGQGEIAVTPLQMVRLYAAIANGGDLLRPYLVREHGILDQRTVVGQRDVMSNFEMSPETLRIIRAGLCDVVTANYGTASHIFRDSPLLGEGIGVCGKTGTAEHPVRGTLEYSWFAAYAPADNPEIATIVLVEKAGDGSAVAAPLTRQIMEFYFFLSER